MHQAAFMPGTETVEDLAREKVTIFGAFVSSVPSQKPVSVGRLCHGQPMTKTLEQCSLALSYLVS